MISFLRKFLAPPIFADDVDKTHLANVAHNLLLATCLFLLLLEGVLFWVPFPERPYFLIGLPILAMTLIGLDRMLYRGRVQLATTIFVSLIGLVFTLFLPFSGGMRSPAVVFYIAGSVIVGLLLGKRAMLIHLIACSVVGLGMILLQNGPYAPPLLFPIPPLVGWMGMLLSLAMAAGALEMVMQRREAALASLRESEERYRQLFEAESDAIFLIDNVTGQILEVNSAAVALYGYSRAELLAKHNVDLSAEPEDTRRVTQTTPVIAEQVITIPLRLHRKKDGTVFPVEITGRFFNWKGHPVHIAAVRDITARRRTEEELHEKTTELEYFFTLSPDLLCIADTDGYFWRLNPEWEKTLGYTLAELEGQRFLDFVHPDDIEPTLAAIAMLEQQQAVLNFENRYRCRDGTYRWIEWRASPRGKLIYAAARDVTARKEAEKALEESEARYRSLFEDNRAVILIYDRKDGRIIDANPAACAYYGWTREELTEKYIHDIDPLTPEEVRREIEAVRREGRSYYLFKHRRADGSIRDVEIYSGPIKVFGQTVYYAIIHDVTERRLAEEALRESNRRLQETLAELRETQERMMHQERLAAVGQLAAGIAHDFNNILASIVLYTQMSLRNTDLPLPLRQRLEVIEQQTAHAADLIQQILDFGRRAVLERQPLMVDSFLKEIVKLLRRTLPENLQIDLTIEAGDHAILADPTRIQQAVVNLALNARDAMPNGGELHISLARIAGQPIQCVDCGPVLSGEWVEIAVADTGTGIPPEVLPHIFEPFFTTRAPLGHGLGLAQVYGIVNQHGGHIAVETQPGKGTTFRLYWPALQTSSLQPEASLKAEVLSGQGETIMVVEDDALVRAALIDALDMLGYRALEAANGQEALTLYTAHADTVALVISDWVMPTMSGSELVRALYERAPSLKVLMLTGHPLNQETRESVPPNVVGWILKPPNLERLSRDLHEALHNTDRG
ncbi:MAG TPA: PAS domain S-box protein [Anaerolineae bacterium]|nr:PAS domain S-box protein [Anaerolineae bacterium]